MELTLFYTMTCIILSIILSQISFSSAKPTYIDDRTFDFDGYGEIGGRRKLDRNKEYVATYGQPLTPSHLSRLRRGYYYIDDGYIAPVSNTLGAEPARKGANHRRQYSDGDEGISENVRFTPLVRYKQTRTNRKKLFVPNLFG